MLVCVLIEAKGIVKAMKRLYTYRKRKIFSFTVIFVLAFFSMYAFAALKDIQGETWCITNQIKNTFTIETTVVGILTGVILWKYSKIENCRLKVISFIFGIVTGFLYVFSWMLQYQNNIGDTYIEWIKAILIGAASIPIPMGLFAWGIDYTERNFNRQIVKSVLENNEKERSSSKWKIIIFYWIVFFVGFIPAFLSYYPGLMVYDAQYQFMQIQNGFMTTHHPVIHMILFKLAYQIGTILSSMNKGIALFSIFQMLILSFAFAYAMGFLKEIHIARRGRAVIAIILVVFPINAVYSVSVTKDVFFAAFFLLFVIETLYVYGRPKVTIAQEIFYVIVMVLMLLFRNNALYAFVVSIPFLLWIKTGKRKKQLALMALSVVLFFALEHGMKKAEGAFDNSSTKEMLALPIQQMARVYAYKEDARAQMQDVLRYIPDNLLRNYNPYIADHVKNGLDNNLLKENMSSFVRSWIRTGLRHPGEYIEAFLSNNMGYWYLDDTIHARIYGEGGYMLVQYNPDNFGGLIKPRCFSKLFKSIYDSLFQKNGYQNIPLLSVLFRPAVYFHIYFVGLMYIIYQKKYRLLLPFIPVICYFLTVLLAPVALLRYIYCLIPTLLFVIAWVLEKLVGEVGDIPTQM